MSKKVWIILLIGILILGGGLISKIVMRQLFKPRKAGTEKSLTDVKVIKEAGVEIVIENLEIPWEIGWLPDGTMLVTERVGRLLMMGENKKVIEIEGVEQAGEGGLLGLAVHPKFRDNQFIYLYLTSKKNGQLVNRVERYRLENDKLKERKSIVEGILGASYHDGGRIEFGPDEKLYITTGDAGQPELAQDKMSLNGKILRVNDDGRAPDDNPFNNEVYSLGHRNPQGLAFDDQGRLWITEHGPSGAKTGNDELNLVMKGRNYGWPEIVGQETKNGMETPVIESGREETWAPAGLEIIGDMIVFGGLRGESVYMGQIEGELVKNLEKKTLQEWGRIRAVRLGPDGWLYLSTSNFDGRGEVREGDDRVVRVRRESI